eukprot:gene37183-42114_t
MADEKDESWLGDRSKINLEEEWEVAFWTRKLGLTRDQLAAVVKVAGPVVFSSGANALSVAQAAGLGNVSLLAADDGSGKGTSKYGVDLS